MSNNTISIHYRNGYWVNTGKIDFDTGARSPNTIGNKRLRKSHKKFYKRLLDKILPTNIEMWN